MTKLFLVVFMSIVLSTSLHAYDPEWSVNFTNKLAGYQDTFNAGIGSPATDGYDSSIDVLQPTQTGTYIKMTTTVSSQELTEDYRSAMNIGDNKTFEIVLEVGGSTSLQGDNTLEWEHNAPADIQLTLIDYGPDSSKTFIYDQFNLKDYYAYEFYIDNALGHYTYLDLVVEKIPPPTIQVNFSTGWNLFSVPLQLNNNSVDAVLQTVSYSEIFAYDFEWYSPSHIQPGHGYWINVNTPASLTLTGAEVSPIYNLSTGWTLLGDVSMDEQPIPFYFNNDTIFTYDGTWHSYAPNRPFNSITTFKPGYGYWIYHN